MDYTVIAAELARHGVRVAPDAVQRAEWQARVHLDDQLFARAAGATRDPQALDALALVHGSGARAAAISNSNGTVGSLLTAVGLGPYLDFVVDSGEVGVEKPSPRIFELALARARVAASEAAYIGDFYSIDVRGAGAAGLRAVLLDPGGFWGARDCPMAPDLLSAVRLALSWE
jgi:HAD superfamily hydrolase (TIGR01549 family)